MKIECPFCGEDSIEALFKPSYLQAHTSRISNKSATTHERIPERKIPMSGCEKCNKTKKEIVDRLNGKISYTQEERIERLKRRGLPLQIKSETLN